MPEAGDKTDRQALLQRLRRYCAYQERCTHEVREKLASLGCTGPDADQLVRVLKAEGFVDDRRYAQTIACSKMNQKGWGRRKIADLLQRKGIDPDNINQALALLEDDAYRKTLQLQAAKKVRVLRDAGDARRHKLAAFLIRKGFEPDLVWREVNQLLD